MTTYEGRRAGLLRAAEILAAGAAIERKKLNIGGYPHIIAMELDSFAKAIRAEAEAEPVAGDVERTWLISQLQAWPTRIDKDKTINVEFLMKSAATALQSADDLRARDQEIKGLKGERDHWFRAAGDLRARIAELERERDEFAKFLKPGQTVLERMKQDHRDIIALMDLLAAEKVKTENYSKTLDVINSTENDLARRALAAEAKNARLREAVREARELASLVLMLLPTTDCAAKAMAFLTSTEALAQGEAK